MMNQVTSTQEISDIKQLAQRTMQRARRVESGQLLTSFVPKKYTKQAVIDAYQRIGDLRRTCAETGCPPYAAYIILQCSKMLRGSDRQTYGGPNSIAGRAAEDEFQRLIPDALDMNGNYTMNNPGYDFDFMGVKIDVKFSSLSAQGPNRSAWHFHPLRKKSKATSRPDFFVLFATEGKTIKDGYKLFVFPRELVGNNQNISFQPEVPSIWHDFEIVPASLRETLVGAAQAMRDDAGIDMRQAP